MSKRRLKIQTFFSKQVKTNSATIHVFINWRTEKSNQVCSFCSENECLLSVTDEICREICGVVLSQTQIWSGQQKCFTANGITFISGTSKLLFSLFWWRFLLNRIWAKQKASTEDETKQDASILTPLGTITNKAHSVNHRKLNKTGALKTFALDFVLSNVFLSDKLLKRETRALLFVKRNSTEEDEFLVCESAFNSK